MGIPSRCHPAFEGREIPQETVIGAYRLTILHPAGVDEDLEAVRESADGIRGMFGGDWPDGLTREDNLWDLAWHLREFEAKRSFAWVIRDAMAPAPGPYLGCAYVFPSFRPEEPMGVWYWMRAGEEAHGMAFEEAFGAWLASAAWPGLPAVITGRP